MTDQYSKADTEDLDLDIDIDIDTEDLDLVHGGDILHPPGFSLSKHQRACITAQPAKASIDDVASACLPRARRGAYIDAVVLRQDEIESLNRFATVASAVSVVGAGYRARVDLPADPLSVTRPTPSCTVGR